MQDDIRCVLRAKGYVRMPDGSYGKVAPLASRLPDTQPQHDVGRTLVSPPPDEAGRPPRLIVRVTRFACAPVDFDNGAGGCKYVVDALRKESLIDDDNPNVIDLVFRQTRVKARADEGTMIEIELV